MLKGRGKNLRAANINNCTELLRTHFFGLFVRVCKESSGSFSNVHIVVNAIKVVSFPIRNNHPCLTNPGITQTNTVCMLKIAVWLYRLYLLVTKCQTLEHNIFRKNDIASGEMPSHLHVRVHNKPQILLIERWSITIRYRVSLNKNKQKCIFCLSALVVCMLLKRGLKQFEPLTKMKSERTKTVRDTFELLAIKKFCTNICIAWPLAHVQ